MDEKHITGVQGCPLTTKKPKIENYAFSSVQRAIHILLQYASTFEGLFTIPIPDDLSTAAWKTISTNEGDAQGNMREMDLHVLAAGLLLHLKELDGSLLTIELHDRFVAAAAISSRYSQIYIFRLLLGELPPINHAILRDLALLLHCITLRNSSNVSKKVIMSFGRLLMKKKDNGSIVHRKLTIVDAGTLFTMALIEEWNYLFQYGQTCLIKNSKINSSNFDHALGPNQGKPSTRKLVGLHGIPNQQDPTNQTKREKDAIHQSAEGGNKMNWYGDALVLGEKEHHEDKVRQAGKSLKKNCQAKGSMINPENNQNLNFKPATMSTRSLEEETTSGSSFKKKNIIVNQNQFSSTHLRSSKKSSDKDGLGLGMEILEDISKSSSMKSTKSTLSSQEGELQVLHDRVAYHILNERHNKLARGEVSPSCIENQDRNFLYNNLFLEERSKSRIGEASNACLDNSTSSDLGFDLTSFWEGCQPSSNGGETENNEVDVRDTMNLYRNTCNTRQTRFSKDNFAMEVTNHGKELAFYGYSPSNLTLKSMREENNPGKIPIPSFSTFPTVVHRRPNAQDSVEERGSSWQSDEPDLSVSCMDRLQEYIESMLQYKKNKGSISRAKNHGQFQDKGAKGIAKLLNNQVLVEDAQNSPSSQDRLFFQPKAICRVTCSRSYQNFKNNHGLEQDRNTPGKHSSCQDSNVLEELDTCSITTVISKEGRSGSHAIEDNENKQLDLAPSDLERIEGFLEQRGPHLPLEHVVGIDTKGKNLEGARSTPILRYNKNNHNKDTHNKITMEEAKNQCVPIASSTHVAKEHSHNISINASVDNNAPTRPHEGINLGNHGIERVCENICSSFAQSRKSVEGVLGVCVDAVTSFLPILQPTILLDQELPFNSKDFCECKDVLQTISDPLTHDHPLHTPCIPPCQTPRHPLPSSIPPPPPPPPPPPFPPHSSAKPSSKVPSPPPKPIGTIFATPIQTMPCNLYLADTPTPPPPLPPPPPPSSLRKMPPPPPPPKKITPPPPPPPGQKKSGMDMQARRPKMKQLVWDKITGSMADMTIWKTATPSEIKMDLKELQKLFCVKDKPPQNKSQAKTVFVGKRTQGVQIIDLKRAHNIGIQLRSLRKPIPELCCALRNKEESLLTMEVLNVMRNTLPNEEDIVLLQGYQGNLSELAEVEMYYKELLGIPRYEKLIKVFIFKGQYNLTFQQVEKELRLLERAYNQLKGSQRFKKILEMVLAVGNFLNSDSFHGAARGFKLGALLKLMDVKSTNNKTTLLHFVVAELMRTDEKVLKLNEESRAIKATANLSLERLQSSVWELENGLKLIKEEISLANEIGHDDQHLLGLMMPFYEKANLEVVNIRNLYNSTLSNLKDLAIYFGETLKQEMLMDLFKTMREFFFMFDQVTLELQEARRREVANNQIHSNSSYSSPSSLAHKACRQGGHTMTESLRNSSSSLSHSRKLDQEDASLCYSTIGNQENFQSCGQNSSCIGSALNVEDKVSKRLDPLSIEDACYDSDWSTG